MARPRNQFPNLCWHSGDKQWCVYRNGQRLRLGADRPKAEARRLALIAQWTGQVVESTVLPSCGDSLSLGEALELYRAHLIKLGTDARKLARVNAAIRALECQSAQLTSSFRGPGLKLMREMLVRRKTKSGVPLSRRYINHLVDAVVLCVRWLVANDLAPAENLIRLREMSAELAESGGGRESDPIGAVDDATVAKTLEHCPPMLAAMIRVQRATGMRPGELVSMRREEVSTRPDEPILVAGLGRQVSAMAIDGRLVWIYCPSKHKNLHRKKPRVIALGEEAQRELSPILPDAGLVFPGHCVASYGNSIARACARAGVARWGANKLRKAAAAAIDATMGADAAAAMLGHSASRRAIDHYLLEQIEKAAATAAKAG